jgi:hypothetical protein
VEADQYSGLVSLGGSPLGSPPRTLLLGRAFVEAFFLPQPIPISSTFVAASLPHPTSRPFTRVDLGCVSFHLYPLGLTFHNRKYNSRSLELSYSSVIRQKSAFNTNRRSLICIASLSICYLPLTSSALAVVCRRCGSSWP